MENFSLGSLSIRDIFRNFAPEFLNHHTMKKMILMAVVALMTAMNLQAQTSLQGHIYKNPNVLADGLNQITEEKIAESKKEWTVEFEKKKGRKPTAKEIAKRDKGIEEARQMAEAMKKGVIASITVDFKTAKDLEVTSFMKVDEDALKAAGMGWLKRKAMKVAIGKGRTEVEKGTYIVKGNLIIITDKKKDKDTLRISDDGQHLYGKMDDKTKFTLKKIK